ncbi:MAG TPA: hypothetical protein VHF06_38505 [Pseudonocardiaceae bacterium]|jgi:hypothetical protein|nr:hypothetical protein [Pseudonocardiaceae bacterium]
MMRADDSAGVDAALHDQLVRRAAAGEARGTLGTPVDALLADALDDHFG